MDKYVQDSQPGSTRARIDAMSAMPTRNISELPPRPTNGGAVRTSAVRTVLSQAALHMHLPEARAATPTGRGQGPEYDRLRATLWTLKAETKDGLGAVGAQLAMESESTRVTEHVNAQVRAVQRAFGVLADTLEDEVGNMRAADAQQWEQLKVHATQFNEVEILKAELERTRNDLRSMQSAFTAFKTDESAVVARKVEELTGELAEQREQIQSMQKAHTAERNRLVEEVSSLRRWRTDVAAPFIEASGRSVANHEQQIERTLPALQKLLDEVDGRTAKHIPELLHAADTSARRQQYIEEEGARTAAQLARLGEAHTEGSARLEERLRLFRDESRTEAESHELRLRQAAAELESHAEAIRQVSAEGAKHRVEAREEVDTIATAVRAGQAAHAESAEKHERSLSSMKADVREMREAGDAASKREAETLEGVLNLRTMQNQVSAWMEHVQRELAAAKGEAGKSTEMLREMGTEMEAAKTARAAWREELAVVDGKLNDVSRSADGQLAERQVLRELTTSVEVFKREVRATFEASQHAHNRLRELVDERRGGGGNGGAGSSPTPWTSGSAGVWTSDGAAAAREAEAAKYAERRADATQLGLLTTGGISAGSGRSAGGTVRFGGDSPANTRPDEDSTAALALHVHERARYAWDADIEPPRPQAPNQLATRSPPISRGPGPGAFTPSLWTTPAPSISQRLGGGLVLGPGEQGLNVPTLDLSSPASSRMTMPPTVSPALRRLEPRRNLSPY